MRPVPRSYFKKSFLSFKDRLSLGVFPSVSLAGSLLKAAAWLQTFATIAANQIVLLEMAELLPISALSISHQDMLPSLTLLKLVMIKWHGRYNRKIF